jgi:agmatine/peptidylarginine deiminase
MLFTFFLILTSTAFSQYTRRMVAEWEPAYGTLIRWPLGIPEELVVELAEDDSLYVLVENQGEKNQALGQFNTWGVNTNHCRFIFANTYSHWTRDWGPHYIFDEQGNAAIADPMFDGYPWVPGCPPGDAVADIEIERGYEEDDVVNIALADQLGLPVVSLPLYLTGGNIMTDGHGIANSTQQMLDENEPVCDEDCFMENTRDLMGLAEYWISGNPEVYGIQHMDCYAKFLDESTIMVKELDPGHAEYQCVEDLAGFFASKKNCYGRNYEIVRIYCGSYNGDEVAAYTNSLIINNKVLVPTFNISSDQNAIQTYQEAMPGYEIIGIYYDEWYYYDALHCRTMGIFDPGMLRIWHKPLIKAEADVPIEIICLIDDRSNSGLVESELKVYYRENGSFTWSHEILVPAYGLDSLHAFLPGFEDGSTIDYYIVASDNSGRSETLPRTAPLDYYSFETTDLITGYEDMDRDPDNIRVYPSVIREHTTIEVQGQLVKEIKIFNSIGREVKSIDTGNIVGESAVFKWNGTADDGSRLPSGVYYVKVFGVKTDATRKIIILHE